MRPINSHRVCTARFIICILWSSSGPQYICSWRLRRDFSTSSSFCLVFYSLIAASGIFRSLSLVKAIVILQYLLLKQHSMFSTTQWLEAHVLLISMASSNVLRHQAQVANNSHFPDLLIPNADSNITILQIPSSLDLSWPATPFPTPATSMNMFTNAQPAVSGPAHNLTAPNVKCDGSSYGTDLSVASCQEVYNLLPKSRIRRTVGQRREGDFNIPLPFRVLSCEYHCLCPRW